MNLKINNKGFTLVELLIVIVIIAILAAISIVAYNGITDRAHNSAAKDAAGQVKTKAELYKQIEGVYPASITAFTGNPDVEESELGELEGKDASNASPTGTIDATDYPFYYQRCDVVDTTNGTDTTAQIVYYNSDGNETLKLNGGCPTTP